MRVTSTRFFLGLLACGVVASIWWVTRPSPAAAHSATAQNQSAPPRENVAAPPRDAAPKPSLAAAVPETANPSVVVDPAVRARVVTRLAQPLREIVASAKTNRGPLHIPLPLRAGATFDFHVGRIESHESDEGADGVLIGELTGYPGSLVVLSYVGLAQSGTVQIPAEGTAFRVRGTDDGTVRIDEVDLRKAPECAACMTAAAEAEHAHH